MRKIVKYPILMKQYQEITIPEDAEILGFDINPYKEAEYKEGQYVLHLSIHVFASINSKGKSIKLMIIDDETEVEDVEVVKYLGANAYPQLCKTLYFFIIK